MAETGLAPLGAYDAIITPGLHGDLDGPIGIYAAPRADLAIASVLARKGRLEDLAERLLARFGIALPVGPKRSAAGSLALIGTAPGHYLAVSEAAEENFAETLAAELHGAASVSDQSDGRAVLRLWGPRIRDLLAKGLPLDLDPGCFRPGDAAASAIALIGVQLWQLDDRPTYEIAIFRSMASSFAEWLDASAAEYGIEFRENI